MRSGKQEGIPYSLSRWTDIAGKWPWLEARLSSQQMFAFDPRSAVPHLWSLRPEDTLALVFWTKDPRPLIRHRERLDSYQVVVNVTATGWSEVEKGTPDLETAGKLLIETSRCFPKTYWRFSPIPALPYEVVLERFTHLLEAAEQARLSEVFVSYLQTNDRLPERRSPQEKFDLLNRMAGVATGHGVTVKLCQDDRALLQLPGAHFSPGICVPSSDFQGALELESCGCALMVDPFTLNESCVFGCTYCYAADKSVSSKKVNSTRLKVI